MEAFVTSIWRIIPDISTFYAILNIFIVFLKYQVKEEKNITHSYGTIYNY